MNGDHKFINERLLEVAIPPDNGDGKGITLEDCLEEYFNNRIEVKRHLNRRTTLNSLSSFDSISKGLSSHVETVELSSSQVSTPTGGSFSPIPTDTLSSLPTLTETAPSPISPTLRRRATSIVQERFVPERDDNNKENSPAANHGNGKQGRRGSIRKEVMMPAWQMFSLLRKSISLNVSGVYNSNFIKLGTPRIRPRMMLKWRRIFRRNGQFLECA